MEAASSSGPGQKEASAQTAPIRIVKFELAAEAAEAGDGNKDESGEEVYNPHERTIFECDGRTGRVKQCIVGKTSKQPFYVVCGGTSTKEEMVDEVTLQTYSKREEPAAEAAAANPTKEETAAGAAADLVKRSAGNVVGWGDDRPRPKPSGGQYPVEGGPERPWRVPVATAGIMPDRDTEPWRFRTVGGKERWRYKKQGPQAGGDWSPPAEKRRGTRA